MNLRSDRSPAERMISLPAIQYGEAEFTQRMVGALQPFWFRRGDWSEGRRRLEDALTLESGSTLNQSVQASALYGPAC